MKLALFAALAFLPALAFAQPQPPEGEDEMMQPPHSEPKADHGERMLRVLDQRLGLKAEQKKKIEAVIKDGQPEMEKLQKEMQELHERLRKFMRKQHEQVRALLDDEQKEKFDEITIQMKRRMDGGSGGGRRFGPRKRPGPPSENEDREEMGPRDMPPPEMWHSDPKGSKGPEAPGGEKP